MPIHFEGRDLSAVFVDAIRFAFPDARAKRIANALGVSIETGKNISKGRVSRRLRRALVDILDNAIAQNELRLRQLRRELKELDAQTPNPAGRDPADGVGTVPPKGQGPC